MKDKQQHTLKDIFAWGLWLVVLLTSVFVCYQGAYAF